MESVSEFIISTQQQDQNIPHYHAAVEMTVLGINVFHGLPNESVLFSFIILTVLSF